MAKKNDSIPEDTATEREPAPVTPQYQAPQPLAPRQMRVERSGARSEPYVRHFPQIRGGICEFCGVLDPNQPSHFQYKLCPHYRGQQAQCSYCPTTSDPDEVITRSKIEVMEHPTNPGMMIMVCDRYECERAHQKRFQLVQN